MKSLVEQMTKEWRIFSITNLAHNCVANDCALLRDHPESEYNLINSGSKKRFFEERAMLHKV